MVWLDKQGLAPASDPAETMVSAELAHPGLEALVDQAMAGQPLDEVVVAPTESQRATVIPTDPIVLLGKPVPSVHLAEDSGLEFICQATSSRSQRSHEVPGPAR